MILDEAKHDEVINKEAHEAKKDHSNAMPKSVVMMEQLYDLQDKFKRVTNCMTHSSTMQYKIINLGFEKDPENVNLGLKCSLYK